MDKLKSMKNTLVSCIEGQLCHLDSVDAHELGEVVDMVKDLEEAIYYCAITKAMEEKEEKEKEQHHHYYTPYIDPYYNYDQKYFRDMDRYDGRMYYNGNGGQSGAGRGNGGSNGGNSGANNSYSMYYTEREYPLEMRDTREGRSPITRKSYMEAKEKHQDKATHMKELEKYMQDLTKDIAEMIQDASPEEKAMLHKKLSMLTSKIEQING